MRIFKKVNFRNGHLDIYIVKGVLVYECTREYSARYNEVLPLVQDGLRA